MGMSGMYGPADRAESIATIHAALDAGIDLLDTGDFYGMGHNELLIARGAARARRASDYLLSVKFGAQRGPDGAWLGYDASPAAREDGAGLLADAPRRRPRRRLPPGAPRPERADRGDGRRDRGAGAGAGYVRHIGLSEVGAETIRRAAAVHPICDVQLEYSLISRGIEAAILPACRELGIAITAYGVLSRGLISGHFSAEPRARAERLPLPRAALQRRATGRATWRWSRRCARSPSATGATVAQLAIAWVLAAARRSCRSSARARASGWPRRWARSSSSSTPRSSRRSSGRCPPGPPRASATPRRRWRRSTASA